MAPVASVAKSRQRLAARDKLSPRSGSPGSLGFSSGQDHSAAWIQGCPVAPALLFASPQPSGRERQPDLISSFAGRPSSTKITLSGNKMRQRVSWPSHAPRGVSLPRLRLRPLPHGGCGVDEVTGTWGFGDLPEQWTLRHPVHSSLSVFGWRMALVPAPHPSRGRKRACPCSGPGCICVTQECSFSGSRSGIGGREAPGKS